LPRRLALLLPPLLAAGLLLLPPPAGLSAAGWQVAALALLMAAWWMTEALPLAVTALLPLLVLPLLGIAPLGAVTAPYADPLIFLFLGGFLLARALQVWGLDRRLAERALGAAGLAPRRLVGATMLVTAFLSLWVSNTATAMVMLPLGQALAARCRAACGEAEGSAIAGALLLGIAYAATLGGMGSLIGTPPNALFAGYMGETQGQPIGFAEWMAVGLPCVAILLPIAWLVLTRVTFRVPAALAVPERPVQEALRGATSWTPAQRRVALVLGAAALLWLTRPLLAELLPGLEDAGIAVAASLALFLLPAGGGQGRALLTWAEAREIRWDVLILFGGGLALAKAIGGTDLAGWLGQLLAGLAALPLPLLLLAVGLVVVALGELASNTAVAAVFLPVAGATAVALGEPPLLLALPVALFASLGFMLPVATPPNAIVYGAGAVPAQAMLRAGLLLDLLGVAVVTGVVLTLGRWVFL
jgi:sodium-dependent dicarboxylate transporter 2/3/5